MKKITLILITAASLFISSCSKENLDPKKEEGPKTHIINLELSNDTYVNRLIKNNQLTSVVNLKTINKGDSLRIEAGGICTYKYPSNYNNYGVIKTCKYIFVRIYVDGILVKSNSCTCEGFNIEYTQP